MFNCSFLPVFYEYHLSVREGKPAPDFNDYKTTEDIWLGFYGLGKFETYQFIYDQCTGFTHLQEWMIGLKGENSIMESAAAVAQWANEKKADIDHTSERSTILTETQWQHWRQQGYIVVSDLVNEPSCDAVCNLICTQLDVD